MKYRLNRSFFPWLITHSLEFWYYYIGAVASLYFLHHFSSEIPFMAKSLGDLAMGGKLDEIKILDFFLIAVYILLFRTLSRLLFFYPARIQQRNLRMELVNRIETAPPRNYKDYNEGMIFQTLYNDLNRIRGFVGFALLQLGNIVIAATIFIPKIRSFNSDFLIAFSPMFICVAFFSVLIYFFQPYVKRGMDEYAQVQNFLLESYEAKKTIQNYHSEKDFFNAFNKVSDKELHTFFISMLGRVISFPLVKVGFGASLIWAALIVKDQNLPGTDLIFFSSFLFLILEPLMFLSWIGIVSSQGYAGWSRIKELTTKLDFKNTDEWLIETRDFSHVELPLWDSSVKLSLLDKKWNVLIGDTASGKSWLLERYAELLTKNNIRYSLIHQEPYLYNDTIKSNVFLGQEITEEKLTLVKFYLKEFGLDILSDSMDSLLEIELGENGKRVSGGQAKRIALIRSLVCDAEYILWDDPFSSVDLIMEGQIIEKLKNDKNLINKTFVMTSHRLSTVRNCDEIIYISKEDGVVETGKVKELIIKGSKVYEFFEKQLV
jgi:ATP-binding cassette subfamily B protein